ncbi:hypothetical protein ACWDCE_39870, partial [Streptomyces sp. NPDC001123]
GAPREVPVGRRISSDLPGSIADDRTVVRTGFRFFAGAADGEEAVALTRKPRPDVCLLDSRLPRLDALAAPRLLAGEDAGRAFRPWSKGVTGVR